MPGRYQAGKGNAHNLLDSKDQRTIKNQLAAAETASETQLLESSSVSFRVYVIQLADKTDDNSRTVEDPLEPAQSHGNDPSRGAEIDAEIKADEEEYLHRKKKL